MYFAIECVIKTIFYISNWRVEGSAPIEEKYVLVGAPHTSNWDFVFMIAVSILFRKKFNWMGKKSLFFWPIGGVLEFLGGIPIDRSQRGNTVSTIIKRFKESKKLILVVTPEGTRKKVDRWRTGFYYIAKGAGVPIILGYIDYRRKRVGFGRKIWPLTSIESDIVEIREFYKDIEGKYPENVGVVKLDE